MGLTLVLNVVDSEGDSILIYGEVDYTAGPQAETLYNVSLPVDGEYMVTVSDYYGDPGQVALYLSPGGEGSQAINRAEEAISVGETRSFEFEATEYGGVRAWAIPLKAEAGTIVDISAVVTGEPDLSIEVLDEQGVSLGYGPFDQALFEPEEIYGLLLAEDGFYTVIVRVFSIEGDGGFSLSVTPSSTNAADLISELAATGSPLLFGEQAAATLADGGEDIWLFEGARGQMMDVIVDPLGDLDVVINIYGPNGFSLTRGEVDFAVSTEEVRGMRLPQDGSYVVTVTSYDGLGGTYSVSVSDAVTVIEITETTDGVVVFGESHAGSLQEDEESWWTFEAATGDTIDIIAQPLGELDLVLEVETVLGESLTAGEVDSGFDGSAEEASVVIPADGMYTIVLRGFAGDGGNYSLTVTNTPAE